MPILKNNKTDKVLHDEIDKIIKMTKVQNLAIRKIFQASQKTFKTNQI